MTTSPPRLQRASGESRVAFALRDGETRLADLYQRDPCRVLFPDPEPGEPPQAVLLTTSGGVAGGDRLRMELAARPAAHPAAATPAAEKVYPAPRGGETAPRRCCCGPRARGPAAPACAWNWRHVPAPTPWRRRRRRKRSTAPRPAAIPAVSTWRSPWRQAPSSTGCRRRLSFS